MKTVAAVFESVERAETLVRQLESLGVVAGDIHIVAGNDPALKKDYLDEAKREEKGTAESSITGARIGGGIGILATVVALAIPGVGPIIAGGAMATVLAGLGVGAAAGGLMGALRNLGISHDEAHLYEEAVRRGSVFLAVNVDEPLEPEVLRLMNENGAKNIEEEADRWRADGWTHPYPNDSSVKWHEEPETVGTEPPRARAYPGEKLVP